MDSSNCTTQYVSGMANVMTCDEGLYHRLQNPERQNKGKVRSVEESGGKKDDIFAKHIESQNTTKIKVIKSDV